MAIEFEPAEGLIAVELLDDEDEDEEPKAPKAPSPAMPMSRGGPPQPVDRRDKTVMVQCVAVGKKVTNCKKGQILFVRKYAVEDATEIDDTLIIGSYAVVATVKSS